MPRLGIDQLNPLGHQQITNVSAAVGLTVPVGAVWALIRCEAQSVRWRDDGTNPSATVGMLMLAADVPFLYGGTLTAIKFFETAASAKLNIAYFN